MKSFFEYLRGRTLFDPCLGDADTHAPRMCQFPYLRAKVTSTAKTKELCLSAFSFDEEGAKEKAIKKKSAVIELSRSAERDRRRRRLAPPFEKGGRKL